jgi:membrane protein required for colicin V production
MSIGPWDFSGFDIVVLLILLISLLYAASRGLMRELTSILALFIAASAALLVYGRYRFAAQDFISPSWLADGALGLGAFSFAYMLMIFLLSGVVKKLKGKEIGFIDRLLGAGFGVARGLIVAALGVMLLTSQYRASQDAQEFKEYMAQNQGDIPPEILEKMPRSMKEQLEAPEAELPGILQNSTFYPLLAKIGDGIRALPFTRMKSYAERLKEGDLEGAANEIREEIK